MDISASSGHQNKLNVSIFFETRIESPWLLVPDLNNLEGLDGFVDPAMNPIINLIS